MHLAGVLDERAIVEVHRRSWLDGDQIGRVDLRISAPERDLVPISDRDLEPSARLAWDVFDLAGGDVELTGVESKRIENLIKALEAKEKVMEDIVRSADISDHEAMQLCEKICGILRAVHELREIINMVPKAKVLDAKEELMTKVEDTKRWLKYVDKIK